MKLYKGVGIIALIFFLCLHILGAAEATAASAAGAVPEQAPSAADEQEVLTGSQNGVLFEDALPRPGLTTGEWQQGLKRFPLALGLLLLLGVPKAEQSPGHLFASSLTFSLFKDLPVSYHNLRI